MQKQNLLQEQIEINLPKDAVSRRKLLMKIGATAIALPIIVTVIAPQAVHAQSWCFPVGGRAPPPGCTVSFITLGTDCATDSTGSMFCTPGGTLCTTAFGGGCMSAAATAGVCTATDNSAMNGPGCACICN